jgi:hypothetical protein
MTTITMTIKLINPPSGLNDRGDHSSAPMTVRTSLGGQLPSCITGDSGHGSFRFPPPHAGPSPDALPSQRDSSP